MERPPDNLCRGRIYATESPQSEVLYRLHRRRPD